MAEAYWAKSSSVTIFKTGVQGWCSKKQKFQNWISWLHFPITICHRSHQTKFQTSSCMGSIPTGLIIFTKEIFKNTKENEEDEKSLFITIKTQVFALLHYETVFLRSWRFFWHPYWHTCQLDMSYHNGIKYVINDIFDINDIYGIWHSKYQNMLIWVSKEALGSQEYSIIP